jgi:hypothetical protein
VVITPVESMVLESSLLAIYVEQLHVDDEGVFANISSKDASAFLEMTTARTTRLEPKSWGDPAHKPASSVAAVRVPHGGRDP